MGVQDRTLDSVPSLQWPLLRFDIKRLIGRYCQPLPTIPPQWRALRDSLWISWSSSKATIVCHFFFIDWLLETHLSLMIPFVTWSRLGSGEAPSLPGVESIPQPDTKRYDFLCVSWQTTHHPTWDKFGRWCLIHEIFLVCTKDRSASCHNEYQWRCIKGKISPHQTMG